MSELTKTTDYERLIGKKVKITNKIGPEVIGVVKTVVDSNDGLARVDIVQNCYKQIKVGNLNRVPGPAMASVYLRNIISVDVL